MHFGDAKPQAIPRFGSVVQWDAAVQLPLGLATTVRNCRYTAQSVGTRWGFSKMLEFGAASSSIAGLGSLRYLAENNSGTEYINLLAYTAADGNLWSATPFQQNTVTQLSTDALLALANLARVPGLNPVIAQAYNRGYFAMGDLTTGQAQAMVYDPSQQTLDPVSDYQLGQAWAPTIAVRVGHMFSPSTFTTNGLPVAEGTWVATVTGHLYRCIQAGETGVNQPVWPLGFGETVNDGTVIWQEYTPTCAAGLQDPLAPTNPTSTTDDASPIIAGATVFVVATYNNQNGESINDLTDSQGNLDTTKVLQFVNTTGNPVDLAVTLPPIPANLSTAGPLGANGATSYNLYAYIVQGATDATQYTDPTYYAQFAANVAGGATATLSDWPSGQALPTVNTATIALGGAAIPVGNVDTGLRWMVVLFETRTTYDTGFSVSAPIPVNVTQSGLQVLAQQIPIGPYNCTSRICAFTVAGASSAGPYTFVDQDDVESPGFNEADIPITSTRINDNVTTAASFNFTDTYLPGASDVTAYFNRFQVPPCSDVYFSKTLQQVIYTGCPGYPSGHLVSDYADPEGVEIPGSNVQVSESDGDRTVCWREVRENQISFKENSGHAIIPNGGNPSTWTAQAIWRGPGVVGAKAIDIGVDDDGEYAIFAHRSGPYRYLSGEPLHIGREIQQLWDQINWEYGYLIVVTIDQKNREVRFSVPMGASTVRNCVLTLNFYFGWSDPVVFVQRRGLLVPNVNGRKWSVDDISANDILYVPQRYTANLASLPGVSLANELLVASSDGGVYGLTPNQYFDQNYAGAQVGYMSQWLSVPGPNPTAVINQLAGATCSAVGNGFINVYAIDQAEAIYPLSNNARSWALSAVETQRDFGIVGVQGSRYGIGFDNGAVPGSWFEMHTANLYVTPTYATRLG